MEFDGRILRVLPVKSGTGQKGEWKVLPFVFEYFESDDQRWSDKVLLETMDPAVMGKIGAYVERGADGKGIVENGCMKLKAEIPCRCGFSHSVRDWTDKEGKTSYYNQVRMYKFDVLGAAVVQQQTGQTGQTAMASQQTGQAVQQGVFQQQVQHPGLFQQQAQQPGEDSDDLPF